MKHILAVLGFVFVALFWTGNASAQASSLFPDEPTLQPGDTVNVRVIGEPELSGSFMVHTDGSLLNPLYRDIRLNSVPFSRLDAAMGEYLSRFREDPQFTVEPRLTVVITGEVLEGGLFTFGPGVTIVRAVTYAGLSEDARIDQVRLIRNRQVYDVDFEDVEAQWSRVTIRSGDQIIVRQQPDFMRDVVQPVTQTLGALTSVITFLLFMSGTIGK